MTNTFSDRSQDLDDPAAVLQRFLLTANRRLAPHDEIAVPSQRILVTGGSGCIGSVLLEALVGQGCECLSVSRRQPGTFRRVSEVRYLEGDVRDRRAMDAAMKEFRPATVFHLAAQRDPGQAELKPTETITTNVFGTRNVLRSAARYGVEKVAIASTGKALRLHTQDVYAGSKQLAERHAALIAKETGLSVGLARFTHVVDNSIVGARMSEWAKAGLPFRLHGSDVHFYVQSAVESAQLLAVAATLSSAGSATVVAMRDLGLPVSLLQLAAGVIAAYRSSSGIDIVGFDAGYEGSVHPLTYDPLTAGDTSPLMNAVESSAGVLQMQRVGFVDSFGISGSSQRRLSSTLVELERCLSRGVRSRDVFDRALVVRLDHLLQSAPHMAIQRLTTRARRMELDPLDDLVAARLALR